MSGLQRSSSVRTTASSRSSSSRYRNLGGTIVHKVRLDDPAFDPSAGLGISFHGGGGAGGSGSNISMGAGSSSNNSGIADARKSFIAAKVRMASHSPASSSNHSASPRGQQLALPTLDGRGAVSSTTDGESDSDSSSEGSEDDYGEAEDYPLGPGQTAFSTAGATSASQPMSSASAYAMQPVLPSNGPTSSTASSSSLPRSSAPASAATTGSPFTLGAVLENSIAEEASETVSSPNVLHVQRPTLSSTDSQATIRKDTPEQQPPRSLYPQSNHNSSSAGASHAAASSEALASEIQKLDVLDAYARSDSRSPASVVLTLADSTQGDPPRKSPVGSTLGLEPAPSEVASKMSPGSFATPLSAIRSLPRSESNNSDDVPLCARLGEDAAAAIQQKLIREDRERQVEDALRAIERGGRVGSAKEKRAAEQVAKQQQQQENKALAQAQAQIAAQQAQIQVLLQAQQQLLQHASAKTQTLVQGEASSSASSGKVAAVQQGETTPLALSRAPSSSKSIHAARQAQAAAAAAAHAAGLHRAKTHAPSAGGPHLGSSSTGAAAPSTARVPRRADTMSAGVARSAADLPSRTSPNMHASLALGPAPAAAQHPSSSSTAAAAAAASAVASASSGFAPGSEAELMMRAAAARSPRLASVPTANGSSGGAPAGPAATSLGMGATSLLATSGANAETRPHRPSVAAGTEGLAVAGATAKEMTPAQEVIASAKAGLGLVHEAGPSSTSGSGSITSGPGVAEPASTSLATASAHNGAGINPTTSLQQIRIYIINRQRYGTVLVKPGARAREVTIETLEQENVSVGGSEGGWVIWDVCPSMGIERPLREYEMLSQVSSVRADAAEDYFLLKRTELATYLSLKAVPAVSPSLAGYVYVEDRKKKWTKRWLELREHSLYHAKSEKGKDEVFICSLSTFDVYLVDTTKIKTPRAHAFAIRSQNSITMFEKPDQDYVHYFCLSDPVAHRSWVRAILNARTYVLKQEQAALFKVQPVANGVATAAAASNGGGLAGVASPTMGSANGLAAVPPSSGMAYTADPNGGGGSGLVRQASLSRSKSNRRAAALAEGLTGPMAPVSSANAAVQPTPPPSQSQPQPQPQTLMAQLLDGGAGKYLNSAASGGPSPANAVALARARTTTGGTSASVSVSAPAPVPTAGVIGAGGATRDVLSGPFAKGSLLETMAVSGAGRNGLGVEVASSKAFLQAQQVLAASVVQAKQQQQLLQQQQQQGHVKQQQHQHYGQHSQQLGQGHGHGYGHLQQQHQAPTGGYGGHHHHHLQHQQQHAKLHHAPSSQHYQYHPQHPQHYQQQHQHQGHTSAHHSYAPSYPHHQLHHPHQHQHQHQHQQRGAGGGGGGAGVRGAGAGVGAGVGLGAGRKLVEEREVGRRR